ncbi:hypothetical protein ACFP3U_30090 [Kitasatospora misakiensis]|uniref:Uncharacterized protein n=1 Tax=Kitasatospora misakiensis TaxID=67330 RepID=A0ABW0XDN0_9ACTN
MTSVNTAAARPRPATTAAARPTDTVRVVPLWAAPWSLAAQPPSKR